jgi:hypothetical protein
LIDYYGAKILLFPLKTKKNELFSIVFAFFNIIYLQGMKIASIFASSKPILRHRGRYNKAAFFVPPRKQEDSTS